MFHPNGPTFFQLAQQALSSTERGYDLLAPKFDVTPFRTAPLFLEAFVQRLRREDPNRKFDDVLDVCCGTGAAMHAISPMCGKRLAGIDMSRGMLEQAELNLSGVSHVEIDFIHGDAFDMPFVNQFDLALSFGAFGHVLPAQEPTFIAQIFKSLKPGGCFAFVTNEMPSVTSLGYWLARGFNGAMRVRNLLIRPPFIMYYLTFLWPDIRLTLEQAGFVVSAEPLFPNDKRLKLFQFVKALKPSE